MLNGRRRNNPGLNRIESRIFRLAKPYLQARDNEVHTLNVVEFAFRLLDFHDADRAVVIPAAILHDVGWFTVSEDIIKRACRPHPDLSLVRIHEEESVRIASEILRKINYDMPGAAEILGIIDGHDTRMHALSMNDRIVKDSDKLTRYADNFWYWTRQLSLAPENLARSLEQSIDTWFFLPQSAEMARTEIALRRAEAALL
jgi:HD superfamily phosphohydrolase YqeK